MSLTAAQTRKTYFGDKARLYDHGRESCPKWNAEHAAVTRFLSGKSGTVLDIPVGTGRFLELYGSLGLSCIGMDVSGEMMAQAKAKEPDADIRFGDILDIPLDAQSVDHAVCIRLLTLIDTDEAVEAIKELGRVTRQSIIVSAKVAETRSVQNRSVTHPEKVFLDAVKAIGFKVADKALCRAPHYHVFHLTR